MSTGAGTSASPVEVVEQFQGAWNHHDVDAVMVLMTDEKFSYVKG